MAEDYKGSITLASIVDGESGQPGRGIDNTVIEYAVSTNGSTAPSSGWSTTYPTSFDLGKFLWIRTTVNYTSGNPSISYTVSYKGTNGTSYYTYVRYSKNSTGNPMVTEPTSETKYIGLYSGTSSSAPTSYGSYTWSKYAGDDGAPGEPGDDGKTYYTWIKYASSASPSTADMSDSPTGKSYIGIAYNKESQTESSVPSDYTWSKYVGEDGAPGNSVASISEYYGLSNASTTVPTQWYPDVQTATASNRYLWNYEVVNYTQTASTSTDPKVIGMYSEDGQPGSAGRGISDIVNYYLATSSTAVTTASTGWTSTVQTATETKLYLWNYEKITYTSAPTIEYTTPCVISNYAKDGIAGASGYNHATINVYKRSETNITTKPAAATYYFATDSLTGASGWSRNIPSGDSACYVASANFTSQSSTASVTQGGWSTPIKFVENGATGDPGLNTATVNLYQRWMPMAIGAQTPALPSTSLIYDFATASLSGDLRGWSQSMVSSDSSLKFLWVTSAVAIATSATDSIESSEWTAPIKLVQDGFNGEDGVGIDTTNSFVKYAQSDQGSDPTAIPSADWDITYPGFVGQGSYLWTWIHTAYTDNTFNDDYTVSYQGEDGSERILIESSDEMIYKFYSHADDVSTTIKSYSPSTISFWVLQTGSSDLLTPGTGYDHELELIGSSNTNYKNLWNFFNQVYCLVGPEGEQESITVLEYVRTIENNQILLDFDKLNSVNLDEERTSAYLVGEFQNLVNQLSVTNYYFSFKVYNHTNNTTPLTQDLLAQKPIGVEFGTSDDMAQFRLSANSIQQLIRDTKLVFDAEGLHLSNGAFDITDTGYHLEYPSEVDFNANKTTYYTYDLNTDTYIQCTNESQYDSTTQYYSYGPRRIFEYDPDLHNLSVYGNGEFTGIVKATGGYFSGDLRAATGSFNGTVTAVNGQIGGWYIGEDGLYSSENFDTAQIRLLSSGSIYANNITLGAFAQIESYIQLGNDDKARLWNPSAESSNRYILEAGRVGSERGIVHLDEDGVFVLGDITIDGPNSLISGQQLTTNDPAWWINPERAVFNNIVAKGKIVTSVFETGKVQSVGGAMVFKPSYRVVSIDTANCGAYLEDTFLGSEEDYVYFVDKNGTLINVPYKVEYVSEDKLYIETLYQGSAAIPDEASSIIDIGPDQSVIVGINSNESSATLLLSQGLTISEFNAETNINDIKAFLGNLGINNLGSGYGLYSDNVYLMGSLTTRTNTTNATYAGVNTLSGVAFNQEGISDTSKIIFWAGSNSINPQDIQQAPFQVTEAGTIYAKQGTFEGAIISRSRIEGSEIRTATIYGTGQAPDAGLSIYNAAKAITFYSQSDENDPTTISEVFSIGTDGFKVGNNQFLNIASNGEVSLNINSINTNNFTIGGLSFGTNTLGNSAYDIEFNDGIHFRYNESRFLTAVYNKLTVAVDTQISTIFIVGDNILQYKPHTSNSVVNGYDLYVRSAGG